jgi:hypothetical protein
VAINAGEAVIEDLNNVERYNTDALVSFSAMNKYDPDTTALESAMSNLADAINSKLKIQ